VLCLEFGWSVSVEAQVPKYKQTPFTGLSGLQSLDVNTRQAAALGLGKFRQNAGVVNALIATLHHDPAVVVRQSAAAALSKMGRKGRKALAYAAVCDPDTSMRGALSKYARRVRLQCHESPTLPDTRAQVPRAEQQMLPYLGHPSPSTRLAAARDLVRMRSAQGYQGVWKMMTKDPVWRVRKAAIRMLTRIYEKRLLSVLRYVLTRDPDSRVRMVGLEAVAFLKDPKTVNWLANSVKFETVPKMQLAAVKALSLIGDRNAARALATIAESHKSEDTRAAAVKGLNSLRTFRRFARPILARILGQDRSGKVRAAAMKALATDTSAAACKARAERINDPDAEVRQAVVEQLARCPGSIARPALVSAARDDKDGRVREAAVTLLIKAGIRKAKDTLLAALHNDKEKSIRLKVLKAVFRLPKKERGAPLAEVARQDSEPDLRRLAVKGLARQPALVAVPALETVLGRDRDEMVRATAAKALCKFKDAAAYKALQKAATSDASEKVRRIAAKGAAKSPAQKAWVNALLPQTIDQSPAIRLKAITQLCGLKVPRTYRALILALWTDESAAVRTAVAKCFAEIDHPLIDIGLSVAHDTDSDGGTIRSVEISQKKRVERLQRLLADLKSSNAERRLDAVRQLRPSPNPQVFAALAQRLTKDEEVNVRRSAAVGVFRYRDRKALNKLLRSSQSEIDPKLRRQVGRLYTQLRKAWSAGRKPLNINTLITQLSSNNKRAAVWAAKALATLRDRRSFQPLKKAASSDNPSLRYAAVVALATFGDMTIVAKAARSEDHEEVKKLLIQLNFLRKAEPEKVMAAIKSTDKTEVYRGLEAAAIRQVNKAVPWIVRLALSHVNKGIRHAAVRTLVLYDLPLAHWAIRVAAQHDASKKLRRALWQWAVHVDAAGDAT
jgi:HEAT repeat protein